MVRHTQRRIAAAGILLASIVTVGACRSETSITVANASNAANVAPTAPAPQPKEAPPPVLARRDLLLAAVEARSAAIVGQDDRRAQRALDKRRFELRKRIGCTLSSPPRSSTARRTGPDAGDAPEATYDGDTRRLTLSVAPDISRDDPLVAALAGDGTEAVEGFWLDRPEILEPSCAGPADAQPSVGLVQFFGAEDARTGRRDGRPYDLHVTLPEGMAAPQPGRWDLVLRGRLQAHGDGRAILCRAPAEGMLPACLVSVRIEEVVIVDLDSGTELAKWGRG